jgi:hypothetical protein
MNAVYIHAPLACHFSPPRNGSAQQGRPKAGRSTRAPGESPAGGAALHIRCSPQQGPSKAPMRGNRRPAPPFGRLRRNLHPGDKPYDAIRKRGGGGSEMKAGNLAGPPENEENCAGTAPRGHSRREEAEGAGHSRGGRPEERARGEGGSHHPPAVGARITGGGGRKIPAHPMLHRPTRGRERQPVPPQPLLQHDALQASLHEGKPIIS